jgi:outer membrane protein TolC
MAAAALSMGGCSQQLPSARFRQEVQLPVPQTVESASTEERLTDTGNGRVFVISPRALIPIAFDLMPDIKSSYQRFKSEEARYDFFYAARDSLTPRLSIQHSYKEGRVLYEDTTRKHAEQVQLSLEKRFFDTTLANVGVGMKTEQSEGGQGEQPFVSASLRYPLWASRERLERTSEEIFRRNELNDTQLSYIQTVRNRLQRALTKYYEVVQIRARIDSLEAWQQDLGSLHTRLSDHEALTIDADRRRLDAETTRVQSLLRNQRGWYQVQLARLKQQIGIPFYAEVQLVEEPFNPFEGADHRELLIRIMETDPEIATQRNAMDNAIVQFDLARRGRWDVALQLAGSSSLEGSTDYEGDSDWSVSVGLNVSAVDTRVTESLMRQAQANMSRFNEAIAGRENAIYTATLEPLVRLDTLGQSRLDNIENLPLYEQDYRTSVDEYLTGNYTIDDVLTRRNNLYDQQEEVNRLTFLLGANVSELCAATGLFFEILDKEFSGAPELEAGDPS